MIRKHTLEYDDVMNRQRQEIYTFRNDLLHTDQVMDLAAQVIEEVCYNQAEKFFESRSSVDTWRPEAFREWLITRFPVSIPQGSFDDDFSDADQLAQKAADMVVKAFQEKMRKEIAKVENLQNQGLTITNLPSMDEAIRQLMIRKTDRIWQLHLLAMDHLRSDVNLRAVGQKDPLTEFKHEAFQLFNKMSEELKTEIAHDLFKFEILVPSQDDLKEIFKQIQLERNRNLALEMEAEPAPAPASRPEPETRREEIQEPVLSGPKIGRNEDCVCGSGKKFKKCCGLE